MKSSVSLKQQRSKYNVNLKTRMVPEQQNLVLFISNTNNCEYKQTTQPFYTLLPRGFNVANLCIQRTISYKEKHVLFLQMVYLTAVDD